MNHIHIPLYQIYRPKSKDYKWTAPIPCESDDIALSSFRTLALNQPELSCSYLYGIGFLNVHTGKIRLAKTPRLINDVTKKVTKTLVKKVKSNEK